MENRLLIGVVVPEGVDLSQTSKLRLIKADPELTMKVIAEGHEIRKQDQIKAKAAAAKCEAERLAAKALEDKKLQEAQKKKLLRRKKRKSTKKEKDRVLAK